MKQILPSCLLISLSALLCGCPYDSPYNLDEAPLQNIDDGLLGTWTTLTPEHMDDTRYKKEAVTLFLGKRTDMDYDVAVTGHIEDLKRFHVITNDSITGTAYLSTVAGKQFLNTFIHGKVYIAEVLKDSSSISILPLAEYFTSRLIKNSRELRAAVEFHYKVKISPGYDPFFCLKKMHRVVARQ